MPRTSNAGVGPRGPGCPAADSARLVAENPALIPGVLEESAEPTCHHPRLLSGHGTGSGVAVPTIAHASGNGDRSRRGAWYAGLILADGTLAWSISHKLPHDPTPVALPARTAII